MNIYRDTVIDAAECLSDMEVEVQELIRELAAYAQDAGAEDPEAEEQDFHPSLYEGLSDPHIALLLQLLQQLAFTRNQIEVKNGIEI